MAAVIHNILRSRHVRLIELKEGRAMKNGEEWCPFLEKDADQLVGFESGGCLPDNGI